MAVTRLYFRNTQTNDGTGGTVYDLNEVQGSPAADIYLDVPNNAPWAEAAAFTLTVGDTVTSTSFPTSVVVSSISAGKGVRWRVQRRDSNGVVQANSAYSTVVTTTGTHTETLTLDTTWAVGDRLVVSVEGGHVSGHGGGGVDIGTQDAGAFVDATMTEPAVEVEAALSGAGSLSGSGTTASFGAVAFAGEGALTGDGTTESFGESALLGEGTITADGDGIAVGALALDGSGDIAGSAFTESFGAADLDGAGILYGNASATLLGEGHFEGAGLLGVTAVTTAFGDATLAGEGQLYGEVAPQVTYQYARPTATVTVGGWQVPPLWSKVNEEVENDSPFIYSTDATHCELGLNSIFVPGAGDVTVYVRVRRTLAGADLRVRLMEGATERANRLVTSVTDSFVTYPLTLTELERDSINNWDDLRIRLAREVA